RAGAPPIEPIPDNCTVTNPLPTPTACGSASSTPVHLSPAPSATAALVYQFHLPPSDLEWRNYTTWWTQCLEQCNGYGYTGDCQTAFMAQNVPAPPAYGLPGGDLGIQCLMYSRPLTSDEFVEVDSDQYSMPTAGVIAC
ncbi:hypothetical protein BDY21DRAFT_260233, partial [Lineolata rhizophorae]